MSTLPDSALDTLFRDARSSWSAWLDKPVADETLREMYYTLSLHDALPI